MSKMYNADLSGLNMGGIADFVNNEVPKDKPLPVHESPSKQYHKDLNSSATNNSFFNDPPQKQTTFKETTKNSGRQTHQRPASATKMAYGSKKLPSKTPHHEISGKCMDLEKENLTLKEKENLLSRELTKMTTKIRRIEELVRSGKQFSDMDYSQLQAELEDQFGQIKDENSMLKEKIRKLKVISKGIGSSKLDHKVPQKSKSFKQNSGYSTQIQKQHPHASTHSQLPFHHETLGGHSSSAAHGNLAEQLRAQLVKNEKEIIKLNTEYDRQHQASGGKYHTDEILKRIRVKDEEIREISKGMEDLEMKFINQEKIFGESKHYMDEILKQIREERINNETLKQKNLRLQISSGSVNDLKEQYHNLEQEKEKMESSLKTITSQPFMKRENGQSTLIRLAELQEKVSEKERMLKALHDEEQKKTSEFNKLRSDTEKLKGEREYLQKENTKFRGKFTEDKSLNELNVYKSLFKMDPTGYGNTMHDLHMGEDKYPVWADMEFLERPQEQLNPNNLKQMKFEISKLRHENKDFAAELEKAQNLLQLQRDIEKDNNQYYEAELKRLDIIYRSSALKAEELAKRADEKARQIAEVEKKIGIRSNSPSPDKKNPSASAHHLDLLETQSEFSVMTNESELRKDENVLDFVLQDAEYYYDAFKQVLDEKELLLHQNSLITFVTADFYNHDTETSQISEGYRPLYNTQFSFKNRIDDFYVQFIQKQPLKLDFYISKSNSAIHIGSAMIYLREIIDRETALSDNTFIHMSTSNYVIQKTVRILPANKANSDTPIGTLRFKMRIRKPISEAMRFYREKNEIATLQAHQTLNKDNEGLQRKKIITVQIVKCSELKVRYGEIAKIAPFFYYQFYTFDERYSSTSNGPNPNFDDVQSYEVTFDGKLINYLQKEPLEIILFDDNAPITGVERGGKSSSEENQDMIGIVKIPLQDLIKGASLHDRFPVRNAQKENCGLLEIKVTIMDLDSGFSSLLSGPKSNMGTLPYNKQWENEIIYKIACKLAKFPVDIDTLFGVFSRGQKTVSKEDFKYCVLNRLNLKKDISEREMDLFLRGCPQLVDKEFISTNDFMMLFSIQITQAKNELLNHEAMMQNTIKKHEEAKRQVTHQMSNISGNFNNKPDYDDFQRAQTHTPNKDWAQSSMTNVNFNEMEVMDILAKTKQYGNVERMQQHINQHCNLDVISSADLINALVREGKIQDNEARKITFMLEVNNKVSVQKFFEVLNKSLAIQQGKSLSLNKFMLLIKQRGEALAKAICGQDHNKDGGIGVDGMVAALLSQDFGFNKEEAIEVFILLKTGDDFIYGDFLSHQNPNLKIFFSNRSSTHSLLRADTLHDQNVFTANRNSMSVSQSSQYVEDPKLKIVKSKLKNYIAQQDITLGSLFKLIDSNSNQLLSLSEFMSKMKAMNVQLDDDELRLLFKTLDKAGNGQISYQQFVSEFPEINISYMIKKIKDIMYGVSTESMFDMYCHDKRTQRMSPQDFKTFVKFYHEKAAEHEVDSLLRHFDQSAKGFITKEEFVQALCRNVREQVFSISIEDIIKPLAFKIKKFKVNVAQLFDNYDVNKNGKLSAEEIAKALKSDMNTQLTDDEILVIKEYFKSKFRAMEIKKMDFIDLLQTKFQRKDFDLEQAKTSLQTVKQKLASMHSTPVALMTPFDSEKTGRLTLRNFKVAINSIHALDQYSIDNLARYLDKENEGFVTVNDFDTATKMMHNPSSSGGSSFKHSSSFGKTRQKWGN